MHKPDSPLPGTGRSLPALRAFLFLLASAFLFSSCDDRYDATALALTEFGWEGEAAPDNPRVRDLKAEIVRNRAILTGKINAAGNLGRMYRALGLEYERLGLYALALGAWEQAMEIETNNPAVHYHAGLMAGQCARLIPEKSKEYLDQAVIHQENAVRLDPSHKGALYALAILRIYERPDLAEAGDLVTRGLAQAPEDTGFLFLAGYLSALQGRNDQARYWYGKILDAPGATQEEKSQARMNQEALSGR